MNNILKAFLETCLKGMRMGLLNAKPEEIYDDRDKQKFYEAFRVFAEKAFTLMGEEKTGQEMLEDALLRMDEDQAAILMQERYSDIWLPSIIALMICSSEVSCMSTVNYILKCPILTDEQKKVIKNHYEEKGMDFSYYEKRSDIH